MSHAKDGQLMRSPGSSWFLRDDRCLSLNLLGSGLHMTLGAIVAQFSTSVWLAEEYTYFISRRTYLFRDPRVIYHCNYMDGVAESESLIV